MSDRLTFNPDNYEIKTLELEGRTITYRAFEDLYYCENPKDPIQKLNIFAPESYFSGGEINGWTLHTAPIFAPNAVGGYMPGPADYPGKDWRGNINSIFLALEHGYVVASPGIRGRTSGKKTTEFFEGSKDGKISEETGKLTGRAPALIVDIKATVRYLRHNKDLIPGNTELIITNGTSAGGALSALTGATGNSPDYEPYLKEIGAADERDDIFAASCYCPIHNLENADAAYEWQFAGIYDYHSMRMVRNPDGSHRILDVNGTFTEKQIAVSNDLRALFPAYVNSLELKNPENGSQLTLDENGKGSFLDYICHEIVLSAQKELETHDSAERLSSLAVKGSEVENTDAVTIADKTAASVDWNSYVKKITRMKPVPAFDALDLSTAENEEFGTEEIDRQHFTKYAFEHSEASGSMAGSDKIKMLNPIPYIGNADTAKHWRIRHGSFDRDTSLAIPAILALVLKNKGYDVDFAYPWGLPHSGDYDLEDLFAWIDGLAKQ